MIQITTFNGYAYWIGWNEEGKPFYNIGPIGERSLGGYYSKEYILAIKQVPDLFSRYIDLRKPSTLNH